ncbi:MAG: low temperature requirement protein A [Oscillibacter sp.]|nr:low temperature requirement protein A [Oscillibacter sp.]
MIDFLEEEERKVEYIELIYDLIFVHTISRCGSMLNLEEGSPGLYGYLTFLLFSMAVLEIWYFSTLFINRFPQFPIQRNICIFVNMYLLYYLAGGIGDDWRNYYYQIHVAWALILLHLAAQYWLALRKEEHREEYLRRDFHMLLLEAGIILLSMPVFARTGLALSPLALLVGVASGITGQKISARHVDFPHLTERIMLYVVFSFGEMIVELSGFFNDGIRPLGICHSVLAFAFASGLFLNYGYVYDHIIDRNKQTSGDGYLFLHLFLIISLSYLTQVLEMFRNSGVPDDFKIFSLSLWLIAYLLFLSLLERYAKERACRNYYLRLIQISGAFVFFLIMTRRYPVMSFAISVAYIYAVHVSLRLFRKRKLVAAKS